MKRYVFMILLFSVIVTGCFGNAGSGELESVCSKVIDSQVLKETNTYTLYYKEGNINNVILNKEYVGMDMTTSLTTYQKAYENNDGISITLNDNGVTTKFDMSKVSDELMKTFNLKKTYNDQIKTLENLGFACE